MLERLSGRRLVVSQPVRVPRKAPASTGTSSRSSCFSDLLRRSCPTGARTSQFNIPATARVRKSSSLSLTSGTFAFSTRRQVGTNPIEPGAKPVPSPRWIDTAARDDAHHREIATPRAQRMHHRSSERRRQLLERGLGAERAQGLLLSVEVALQRIFDRGVTQRFQRAEVVAHGSDVGVCGIRQLAEGHALLAALGDQVQRRIHESRSRPQAGRATLVGPCRFHRRAYSNRCLNTSQSAAGR